MTEATFENETPWRPAKPSRGSAICEFDRAYARAATDCSGQTISRCPHSRNKSAMDPDTPHGSRKVECTLSGNNPDSSPGPLTGRVESPGSSARRTPGPPCTGTRYRATAGTPCLHPDSQRSSGDTVAIDGTSSIPQDDQSSGMAAGRDRHAVVRTGQSRAGVPVQRRAFQSRCRRISAARAGAALRHG